MKKKGTLGALAASPHIVWSALFIVVPLIFVAYYALTDEAGHFSLSNLGSVLINGTYMATLGRSLVYALVATAVCLLVAYPLAYALSRMRVRLQSLFVMLVMLPMWTNFLIRTYTLSQILEKNGIINSILGFFGLDAITFLGTPAAVVFGMVYNYLPYMVLPIYSVLVKLDTRLIEAANDLGCNSFQTLTRVVLPLSVSGIVSGVTMVFVPSVSTFYISQAMSNRTITLFGDVIEYQFKGVSNYHVGAVLSAILMVLVLISMWVMNRFGDESEGVIA
ncbi:MAG: ABC transporter permease [Clostridia bacterium]|nr:ABC transporter permease [Clostridia bacterium]